MQSADIMIPDQMTDWGRKLPWRLYGTDFWGAAPPPQLMIPAGSNNRCEEAASHRRYGHGLPQKKWPKMGAASHKRSGSSLPQKKWPKMGAASHSFPVLEWLLYTVGGAASSYC